MLGRNNPCPCGSGKKYKKCCAMKDETSSEELVEQELDRILFGYYEYAIGHSKDIAEIERYDREWQNKLGKYMSEDEIRGIVTEYFLFVARRDLWNRYILRVLNGQLRPQIREILKRWQSPVVLLGEVVGVTDDYFLVEELLGHKTYTLEWEDDMGLEKGMLVFGAVLPDNRKYEDGVKVLDGLVLITDSNGAFVQEIESMAEASGEETSADFFKVHMLDIHKAIANRASESITDFVDRELNTKQQAVLTAIEESLDVQDFSRENWDFIRMIAVTYLFKVKPSFRKPETIAAAVVKAAYDLGAFAQTSFYTQADIAEMFGVSVGSMMKHADHLFEVIHELKDEMFDDLVDEPEISYTIGTDPRMTERVNWEMYCKMETIEFDTLEDAQTYMEQAINEPFKAANIQEEAQSFAYEAYEAIEDNERFRLANQAYALDPENVDANLLRVEQVDDDDEIEQLYKQAIGLGKAIFDEEPEDVWLLVTNRPYMRAIFSYGVWLYEQSRMEEAVNQFEKLLKMNPEDHLNACYLAIASHIHAEQYLRASQLLHDYEAELAEDAPYLFLAWLLEEDITQGESEIGLEMYEEASAANPFVSTILEQGLPRLPFPRFHAIAPGSIDEAIYIHYLLTEM